MPDDTPQHIDERLRRLVGDDDVLRSDPLVRRVVHALDGADPDEALDSPPPGLWDAIAAAVEVDEAAASDASAGEASVVALGPGGRPPWWLGAAAAILVVVVVAIGAVAIVTGRVGDDETPLAAAELELLVEESEAAGAARLVQQPDDDSVVLVLDVAGLDDVDGYYEVWLLTPEVDGLVSLGPLRPDGRYAVPTGLDHRRFSVVDISVEPHDGDPAHSGNSVLRGGLVEA